MSTLQGIIDRTGTDDIIALMLTSVSSAIWLSGNDLPETLGVVTVTIIGFFFGKKYTERGVQNAINLVNPAPSAPLIGDDEE